MSENIKVVVSPKHFMVLDAVSGSVEDAGKIARVTKTDKAEVEMIPFTGIAMNHAESAITGDAANADAQAAAADSRGGAGFSGFDSGAGDFGGGDFQF